MTTAMLVLPNTRLIGRKLWIARTLWAAIMIVTIAMFIVNGRDQRFYVYTDYGVRNAAPFFATVSGVRAFVQYLIVLQWIAIAVFFAVAWLIAWRKSADWQALFVSAALPLMAFMLVFIREERLYPDWLTTAIPFIEILFPLLAIAAWALLFHLFPYGRPLPRWLIVIPITSIATATVFQFAAAYAATWWRFGGWRGWLYQLYRADWGWYLFIVPLLAAVLSGLGSQIVQYRRTASPVQRQQTRWILFGMAASLMPVVWGTFFSGDAVPFFAVFELHLTIVAMTMIPITIGIAILRYRLWDIEIVVNRTLVYGGLTLALVIVYGLIVGGMATFLQPQASLTVALVAAVVLAVVAHPLRVRLQRVIDRFMYGDRDDPLRVLTVIGERLESAESPALLLPILTETIATSLKLPYVAIFSGKHDDIFAAATGEPQETPAPFALTHLNQHIGRMVVSPRAPGEQLTAHERRLLTQIAQQVASVVYAAQINADLQQSREHLVLAREEERRRLRRDLHDGLGPQLATLTLQIDAARNVIAQDPDSAETLLRDLKTGTQNAIAEVRRVVHDLRPPALDQLGLVEAVRQYATRLQSGNLTITVAAPKQLPPLPAAVEVAAYRIAVEALTNVVRHAQAMHSLVRIALVAEGLLLTISDDGRGLVADAQPGVGLATMRERAAELGGTLTVSHDNGVTVAVSLPFPEAIHDE
ncbi:MAG: sensor histidine kinase [Anaerolineae bacterium]|nr:sensor histidine kinase [Anaerolineae bacterium]